MKRFRTTLVSGSKPPYTSIARELRERAGVAIGDTVDVATLRPIGHFWRESGQDGRRVDAA